ncbi:transient receptor potential channel pyrexia-like [Cloeon dipterum]|uniref:transient receptor potential channel pyrexia-like n=1 Tax=Cloeon dipterum TaxID=197152 RepID=UPI003220800A
MPGSQQVGDENIYEMVDTTRVKKVREDVESAMNSAHSSAKYNTAPASYFNKIKMSFREKLHGIRGEDHYDVVQTLNDELCPVDLSDSFEDLQERLLVKIGRELVRNSIIEMMRNDYRMLIDIEEGNEVDLERTSCEDRHVLLLWAAFLRRKDILEILLAKRDCQLQIETPESGLSALHLAAFSGCHECVLLLLNSGVKMTHRADYSPLHCAAQSGSIYCVRLLLKKGAEVNSKSEDITIKEHQDSALHCAIKADSPEIVRELLKAGADPTALGQGGLSPLHVAADLGYMSSMRALLEFWKTSRGQCKMDINQKTVDEREYTAMHLLAEDQCADGIRLLKEYGAACQEKSSKGMTPLHLACREQSVECAKLLLESCDINEQDKEERTPLHMALGRPESTEITEFLVCQAGIKVNMPDKHGFIPLHIAALNEQAMAAAILIRAGADLTARTNRGSTALRLVIRKVPAALYAVEELMDASITLTNNMDSRDVELKMDFKPLLASKKRITTDLLNTFIAEGHPELMQHPLCQAFLHIKWKEVRMFYFLRLLYYFVFLLCISIYVNFLSCGCSEFIAIPRQGNNDCAKSTYIPNIVLKFICKYLISLSILEALRKLYGLIAFCVAPTSVSIKKSLAIYVKQKDNWLEWICLICITICATLTVSSKHAYVLIYIGATAVLSGWFNLMILIGQHPYFGAYVEMYTCVLKEMSKLLMAYCCMLIGFAISFHVLFESKAESFSSIGKSLVKILVMMTGELEFEDLFEKSENKTAETDSSSSIVVRFQYPNKETAKNLAMDTVDVEVLAYIIFVVFLLLVTVVLMNLLVGIAVHDIHGLRASAVVSRLQQQANLIGYIETALPNWCTLKCLLCCCTPFMGRNRSRTRRRTEMGILSVKPHNWKMNHLPREIVSAAFEVAKKMNPYMGPGKRSTKPKPRYKRIYSRQQGGSIYDTIIPRTDNYKRPSITRVKSQYLHLDKNLDNYDTQSLHSINSDKHISDELRELKIALAHQSALLQQLLDANRIGSHNTLKQPIYSTNI